MASLPRVCVVVATYNRSGLISDLIGGLKAQTFEDFEVVIADDDSTDGTLGEIERLTEGDPRFRTLQMDRNGGPARARNAGWRSAATDWIAFTDDDCVPEPQWLERLLAAGADVVQGRTIPASERQGWFDRSMTVQSWSGRYETCNLLVARSYLVECDGFDERFRFAMGEDTDLGIRALNAGASHAFADDAVVRHLMWPSNFREFLRQRYRYAQSVELAKANPESRYLLRFGLVSRDIHLVVLGMIPWSVLLVLLGLWWLIPLPVLAWAAVNARRTGQRQWPIGQRFLFSLLLFVGYSVETVFFLHSSVKYRTLVV